MYGAKRDFLGNIDNDECEVDGKGNDPRPADLHGCVGDRRVNECSRARGGSVECGWREGVERVWKAADAFGKR